MVSDQIYIYINKELKGLSPRANYTDWATAAFRRSDCQLFADRGCHVVSVTDPYARILDFLDRSRYFSIKYLLSCTHEAEWTLFQIWQQSTARIKFLRHFQTIRSKEKGVITRKPSFFAFYFIKLVKNLDQGYRTEYSTKLWPEAKHEITCKKEERENVWILETFVKTC
jgi:hypothetical protein